MMIVYAAHTTTDFNNLINGMQLNLALSVQTLQIMIRMLQSCYI